MAAADGDDSLYPIAVLIDELRNEDVQVRRLQGFGGNRGGGPRGSSGPREEDSVFAGSGGRGRWPISVQLSSFQVAELDETASRIGCWPSGGRGQGKPGGSRACLVRAAARGLGPGGRGWEQQRAR
jgi:hypothetical protein